MAMSYTTAAPDCRKGEVTPKAGAQSRASSLLTYSRAAGPSAVRQSVDIVGILGQVAYEVGEACKWSDGGRGLLYQIPAVH